MIWGCLADTTGSYAAGTGINLGGGVATVDPSVVARLPSAAGAQSFDNDTFVIDYANNRVGVGAVPGAGALDVSGNVRASEFSYPTPKAGTWFVNGASFYHDESISGGNWGKGQLQGTLTTGSFQSLTYPLDLPINSKITNISCYFMDNESSSDMNGVIYIAQYSYGSGNAIAAAVNQMVTSTGASTSTITVSNSPTNLIYDNTSAGWFIWINYGWSSTVTSANRFYGCRVQYTMPRVGR
jgi:hypothetical protein